MLISIAVIISACKNTVEECKQCNQKREVVTNSIAIAGNPYVTIEDVVKKSDQVQSSLISINENPTVGTLMSTLTASRAVNPPEGEQVIALCLFYTEVTPDLSIATPSAILVYHGINVVTNATLWININNVFVKETTLSGITNFVSKVDMYRINQIKALHAQKMVILLDHTKLSPNPYPTIFQVKLGIAYEAAAPSGGLGGSKGPGPCSNNFDCPQTDNGWCMYKEKQNGPTTTRCQTPICPSDNVNGVLDLNGYTVTQNDMDYLYKIRNAFLLNSPKGMQYIDDYYYSSAFLQNNISLDLALNMYNLYGADFFNKLSNFDVVAYDNQIAIEPAEAVVLLEICDKASLLNNDVRFQSIIANVRADINRYTNKTILEVKNDF